MDQHRTLHVQLPRTMSKYHICPVLKQKQLLIYHLMMQFWDVIQLLDKRNISSTEEMYEACLDHLDRANSSGVTEAYITVRLYLWTCLCHLTISSFFISVYSHVVALQQQQQPGRRWQCFKPMV